MECIVCGEEVETAILMPNIYAMTTKHAYCSVECALHHCDMSERSVNLLLANAICKESTVRYKNLLTNIVTNRKNLKESKTNG